MADNNDILKAAFLEAQKRGLIKQGPAPKASAPPPPAEATTPTSILNALQRDAKFTINNFASPDYWRNFSLPGIGDVSSVINAAERVSGIQSPTSIIGNSPEAMLLLNRAFQGFNPVAAGEVGTKAVESNPTMQQGAKRLAEHVGDYPAAALQFGATLAPMAVEAAAGALGRAPAAASAGYTTLSQAVPRVLAKAAKAGLISSATAAGLGALGAEEGNRLNTAKEQLTNPLNFALGAVPALAGEGLSIKAANKAALADIGSGALPISAAERAGVHQLTPEQLVTINRASAEANHKVPTIVEPVTREAIVARQAQAAAAEPVITPVLREEPPTVQGMIGLQTLLDMTTEDRARMMTQRANDALQERPTIIERSPQALATKLAEAQGKTPAAKTPTNVAGKPTPRGLPSIEPLTAAASDLTTLQKIQGKVQPNSAEALKPLPSLSVEDALKLSMPDLELTKDTPLPASMQKTQAMQIPDVAKIQGVTPEEVVARGGGGSVAKKIGETTKVLGDDRVIAEQQAKLDPRTVETPGEVVPSAKLPVDVDVPGAASQDAKYAMDKLAETRDPSFFKQVAKQLALPENRAVPLVSAAIRSFRAGEHIQNVQVGRLFPQIKKVLDALSPAEQRLVKEFVKRNVSPQKNTPPIPVEALPETFRNLFEQGMEQNRAYRDELIKAGYFSPAQIKKMQELEARGHAWLHRDFMAYMDRGYIPDRGLMDRAIRWLVKKSEGKLDYTGAANELINLMSGEGDVQQKFRQSRLNKEILKARSQIPPIIRDVLGEIHEPAYVVSSSMAELERLWRQHKVSQSFTDPDFKGVVWDDKPNKAMAPGRIWNENWTPEQNKQAYGEFAGKYVAPQLHEAIMQAPKAATQSLLQRTLAWISGAFKTSVILGGFPVSYTNNWISNAANAAAAGLPVWNRRFASRLMQSMQAMKAYQKSFLTPRGKAPTSGDALWMQWALEDGAIIPGTGAEFGGQHQRAILKNYERGSDKGLVGLLDAGLKSWERLKNKGGNLYDALDVHWRLAAYIEQVTKGRERLGLPLAEARARASKIVNENFASAGSVGQLVRDTSNKAMWMAPFMTWHADNIRVHWNWLKNAGRGFGSRHVDAKGSPVANVPLDTMSGEGSGQAFNVLMHYALINGLFEGLRRLYNWTDQDTAVAEASLKPSYVENVPSWSRQWLPWRDSKGRAQVISLVPLTPSSVFFKGDPKTNLITRAVMNTAGGFVQGGAAESPVNRALEMLGMREADFQQEVLPGQEGRAAVEAAWEYMMPGLVKRVRDVARRTQIAGELRKGEEPYTLGQAVAAFTPFRAEPVGARSQESVRRTEVSKRNETRGDIRQIQRNVSPKDKPELLKAALEELQRRQQEESKRVKNIRQ